MTTTPARKHSVRRPRGHLLTHTKRKALRRRGLRALRYWKHITRCFGAFHRRPAQAGHSMLRSLRRVLGAAMLALWLPALAQAETFTVTSQSDTTADEGELTLREAIELANANEGPDTIEFAEALSGEVIVLTQGELVVSDDLRIDASRLTEAPAIDANQQSRVMRYNAEQGDLSLTKLTLRNGDPGGDWRNLKHGGGILFESGGSLTLTNSTVRGNSASSGRGGGISSSSGAITINDSTISGNSSWSSGGGISSSSGAITLTDSTISGNSSGQYGGGISSSLGAITLTSSTVSGNYAYFGGGIFSSSGAITLTNSSINGNLAKYGGGGILSWSGVIVLTTSTVNGNSNPYFGGDFGGGGICSPSGAITLTHSSVSGNSTASSGGGIESGQRAITLTNSTVSGNSASGRGGGISSWQAMNTLTNSIIAGNRDDGALPISAPQISPRARSRSPTA